MIARATLAVTLFSAALVGFPLARAAAPVREDAKNDKPDIEKAEKLVKEQLAKAKSPNLPMVRVTEEAVARAFPGQVFFTVVIRQFPIAREPGEPLKFQNVFAINKDGALKHVTDAKGLEDFFRATLDPVKDEKAAKDAVTAWLRLSQEFSQDGFFNFSIPGDAIKAVREGDEWKVSGKSEVKPEIGNKGEITATLTFDKTGKLAKVSEERKVFAGTRPRCQATKLLDPDAIVRAMAEQDILIMGRIAKDYLDEQRAKASPELRQAIDRLWKRILDEGR